MESDIECQSCGIYLDLVGGGYASLHEDPYITKHYCSFTCMIRGLLYRIKEEIVSAEDPRYIAVGEKLIELIDALLSLGHVGFYREDLEELKDILLPK